MSDHEPISYDDFVAAVDSDAAAFRLRTRLQPIGGKGDKLFPSTYEGGRYAVERRKLDGNLVDCVIIDSVQSQANRFEEALKTAWEEGVLKFPLMRVDFSEIFPDIGVVTSLDAPHRIADAVFRESTLDGQFFRDTDEGKRFEQSNLKNATPIYELCPPALIFGTWDSTGAGGGLGNKFARCIVSEIVGIDIEQGVRPAGRLSPLGIKGTAKNFYKTPDNRITYDESEAKKDSRGNPVKAKPSEVNLGNVAPSLEDTDSGANHGGVTMEYAEQTAVLTLAGLRKLRFPDASGSRTPERDALHHRVLAALGLAAVVFQHQHGFDLRSRCALVPEEVAYWEVVLNNGETREFSLSTSAVVSLFERAVGDAESAGIEWQHHTIDFEPGDSIVRLIKESRGLVAAE